MKHRISTQKLILVLLVTSVVTILGMNLFSSPEKEVKRNIAHEYGIDQPQFLRVMSVLLGPTLVEGNKVETLLNGDQIFPAMLAAIRSAKKTISFETYIYWSGEIGQQFADALAERANFSTRRNTINGWYARMTEYQAQTLSPLSGVMSFTPA